MKIKNLLIIVLVNITVLLGCNMAYADQVINIDGHFYDWQNKPLYQYKNTLISFITSGNNAYVLFEFPKNEQPRDFKISFQNGKSASFKMSDINENNKYPKSINCTMFIDSQRTVLHHNGIVNVKQGKTLMELYIPLKKMNSNLSSASAISFKMNHFSITNADVPTY